MQPQRAELLVVLKRRFPHCGNLPYYVDKYLQVTPRHNPSKTFDEALASFKERIQEGKCIAFSLEVAKGNATCIEEHGVIAGYYRQYLKFSERT